MIGFIEVCALFQGGERKDLDIHQWIIYNIQI